MQGELEGAVIEQLLIFGMCSCSAAQSRRPGEDCGRGLGAHPDPGYHQCERRRHLRMGGTRGLHLLHAF